MSVLIGHASIDENGNAKGGAAGDQTGKEVCTRSWYDKSWDKLIRPKNSAIAEKIAKAMEQACTNNNIGYDQSQRTTLYTKALAAGWDLSRISTKCETDCSALVAVCVNAAGVSVSQHMYTGNEANLLKNTGKFDILTDSKYLKSDTLLKRGDILLKEGSHTVVVLSNGSGATTATTTTSVSAATTTKATNPYKEPTTNIKKGSKGTGVKWVQWELNQAGASLAIDGVAGDKTDAAIRAYQKKKGLTVDGIVGKLTRAKMKAD